MKSRKRKPTKKRETRKKILRKKNARRRYKAKRRIVRRYRARRNSTIALNPHQADIQRRVARVLRRMLEEHESLSKATRLEGIKSKTFVRYARPALRRNGPGKPWKAISEDQLPFVMKVLTKFGAVPEIIPNRRERKLLGAYNRAIRMFRASDDGAEAALRVFRDKKIAGHTLITNVKSLIELEEAGKLDFDDLYSSLGEES